MAAPSLTNALTIDVEDYFQVSAFAPHIARSSWDARECRVERNVGRILEMLAERQTHATFFTLGWVAQRYPALVRQIVDAGHELASHGYGHERASDLTEQAFLDDITRVGPDGLHIDVQQADGSFAYRFIPLALEVLPDWSICAGDLDQRCRSNS